MFLFILMQLCRPSVNHLKKRCKYQLRKHQFQEIAAANPMEALSFLQNQLHDMVDHKDEEESKEVTH